jgi:hypothetical protein
VDGGGPPATPCGGHGFAFDYRYDAEGHSQQRYCRSDHYMYARYGIPVVFMSTGAYRDDNQRTDEAQYVDYGKLTRVTEFVHGLVNAVRSLDQRLLVDGPIPEPDAPCQP